MEGYVVHGAIRLPRGSFGIIEDGRGIEIELWDGELWVTQHADTRDHRVRAGGAFQLAREGRVIFHALRESSITLVAPVPAQYARRIVIVDAGGARHALYERSREGVGWLAAAGHRLARLWMNWYAAHSRPTTAGL